MPKQILFKHLGFVGSCALVLSILGCSEHSPASSSTAGGSSGNPSVGGSAQAGTSSVGGSAASTGGAGVGGDGAAVGGGSGDGGSGGGGGGSGGTGIVLSNAPYGWVGVVGTGQSLSTGCGTAAVSTEQPFKNLKLLDQGADPKYPTDGSSTAAWSVIPLVEPIRVNSPGYGDTHEYPNNICENSDGYGETPHSGMANAISAAWAARGAEGDYITAHTVVGTGGVPIGNLLQGTISFDAALSEAQVFTQLAADNSTVYGVGAIIFTHGENDALAHNATYGSQVFDLWQTYNTDLKAITGQTQDVVMLASQQTSIEDGYGGVAVQLWKAGLEHPGQIVVTGAKYAYSDYYVHLPASGSQRLGEKYGEVFDLIVNQGVPWKPVGPNHVERSGAVITADFDVPNPPLVWDSHLAMPHQSKHTGWANGKGFEVVDENGGELAIASVEIQGSSVVITLTSAPAEGAELTLAYALTSDVGPSQWLGGATNGMHGLLRDSDDFAGAGAETIELNVTNGSDLATEVAAGSFARRGSFDIVTGGGLPEDTVIDVVGGTQMHLSTPWTGATGKTSLTFQHNHHNFCVQFAMTVP